jgi:hypothetical protein
MRQVSRRWLALAALLAVAACESDGPVDPTEETPLGPPRLESVEPSAVRAGARVLLRGRGFRPDPAQNLVVFDGFRGRVVAASDSTLQVDVPACLPTRRVAVSVVIDSLSSQRLPLDVAGEAAALLRLEIGESRRVEVADGTECVQLAGGARYLLVTQSASTVGGGLYGFSLRGVGPRSALTAPHTRLDPSSRGPRSGPSDFRERLRMMEDHALAGTREESAWPARATTRALPPRVGDVARFRVVDNEGRFHEVQSVVRFVGTRVAIHVDLEAPMGDGGLTDADLRALANDLDDPVFPVLAGAFGTPSDVDGNERVIVLITPDVNRLTPRGSTAFVGGFFFGVDLLPAAPSSNGAELLYAMVPDPQGQFGDPRSRELVLGVLPSILAHELQHMVHYNERMLVRQASRQEALWLSEALAQSAETLVGDSLRRRGDQAKAARSYLREPGPVSLLVSVGQGSLEERGAGWLFLRYLQGLHPSGGTDLLRSLTRTTRTGLENLEAVTQRSWLESFSDWSVATYMDSSPRPFGTLHYPDFDLRTLVSEGAPYPLSPTPVGVEFDQTGTRLAASSAYYVFASDWPAAVRLADPVGGAPAPAARFILRVVRLQ